MFLSFLSRLTNRLRVRERREGPSMPSSVLNCMRSGLQRSLRSPSNSTNTITVEVGSPEWIRLCYQEPELVACEEGGNCGLNIVPRLPLIDVRQSTNDNDPTKRNNCNREVGKRLFESEVTDEDEEEKAEESDEESEEKNVVGAAAGYSKVRLTGVARPPVLGKDFAVCASQPGGADFPPHLRYPSSHNKELHKSSRSKSTPPPRLGFTVKETRDGTRFVSYTAFILAADSSEIEHLKSLLARRFRGLEQRFRCRISISQTSFKLRSQNGYILEIRGSSSCDVSRCRNSLPKFFTDKLITSADSTKKEFLSRAYKTYSY